MPEPHEQPSGQFDARYVAFLETITHLRPRLHRYCARMTGSSLDGEDVVQEALFQAYRKLDAYDDSRPLTPWLFRIAHNRCIDFLRRREARADAESAAAHDPAVLPVDPPGAALGKAVEHLVVSLPPMERACVLLKDVFDYSLDEIAGLVDSTTGGVKAALHRGRAKLASGAPVPPRARPLDHELRAILELYVERFNSRDWDGVRALIAADARVQVADRFIGRLDDSPYFGQYQRSRHTWRLVLAAVDGEHVVVQQRRREEEWQNYSIVRIEASGGRIVRVTDYTHCSWMFEPASVSPVGPHP